MVLREKHAQTICLYGEIMINKKQKGSRNGSLIARGATAAPKGDLANPDLRDKFLGSGGNGEIAIIFESDT